MPTDYTGIGRIGGKLLSANLLRNGADLAFDTDLLYIKVGPEKIGTSPIEDGDPNPTPGPSSIGINTDAPVRDLTVNGYSKISNSFIVNGTSATLDNVVINTDGSFSSVTGPIIIAPTGADAYVEYGKVLTTDFEIKDNYIKATTLNSDIALEAAGIGKVSILNDTRITGNLDITKDANDLSIEADGDIRLDGQFIIGDSPIDTVAINTDLTQDIVPGDTDSYDLGSPLKRWKQIWLAGSTYADNISVTNLFISEQTLYTGNTITTLKSDEDLEFLPDTGITLLEQLSIQDNTITNLQSTPITLIHTGNGYLKFLDTNAMRIPVGTTAERENNEIGETRWNTDLGYLECFDGTVWQVATGGGTVVTPAIMQELSEVYTLILG